MLDYDRIINNLNILKQKEENPDLQIEVKSNQSSCFHELAGQNELSFLWLLENLLRIKPKSEYRPYKKVKGWWVGDIIIPKKTDVSKPREEYMIINVNKKRNEVLFEKQLYDKQLTFKADLDYLFDNYVYKIDGEPFGELIEE